MTSPIAPRPALATAVAGMQRESARVARAAETLNQSFAAAQNARAADSVAVDDRAAVAPAVEDAMRGAALPPEGDLTRAVVDVMQARAAYQANAKVARVAGDLEAEMTKFLK